MNIICSSEQLPSVVRSELMCGIEFIESGLDSADMNGRMDATPAMSRNPIAKVMKIKADACFRSLGESRSKSLLAIDNISCLGVSC